MEKSSTASTNAADAEDAFDAMDSLLEFSAQPAEESGDVARTLEEQVLQLTKESEQLRDPFWPIGFTPAKLQEKPDETTGQPQPPPVVEENPEWDAALKTIAVSGIMAGGSGGTYMAVINGKVVGEGDTISATLKGRRYNWKVNTISQRGVTFKQLNSHR